MRYACKGGESIQREVHTHTACGILAIAFLFMSSVHSLLGFMVCNNSFSDSMLYHRMRVCNYASLSHLEEFTLIQRTTAIDTRVRQCISASCRVEVRNTLCPNRKSRTLPLTAFHGKVPPFAFENITIEIVLVRHGRQSCKET